MYSVDGLWLWAGDVFWYWVTTICSVVTLGIPMEIVFAIDDPAVDNGGWDWALFLNWTIPGQIMQHIGCNYFVVCQLEDGWTF